MACGSWSRPWQSYAKSSSAPATSRGAATPRPSWERPAHILLERRGGFCVLSETHFRKKWDAAGTRTDFGWCCVLFLRAISHRRFSWVCPGSSVCSEPKVLREAEYQVTFLSSARRAHNELTNAKCLFIVSFCPLRGRCPRAQWTLGTASSAASRQGPSPRAPSCGRKCLSGGRRSRSIGQGLHRLSEAFRRALADRS